MHRHLAESLSLSCRMTIRLALVVSLLSLPLAVNADPQNISESEWKLLPRYCPDTMAYSPTSSPRFKNWEARMGIGFKAMHHFCWAQISMIRAAKSRVPAQTRQFLRSRAQADYWYVINNTPPDFIMLPEVYTRIGEVELLLRRPKEAGEAFARARELKPDYWPGYSHWAEFLIRTGQRAEAKQLVQSGLEYSPKAKVLLVQYKLLGGNASDIVPKTIATEPDSAATDSTTAPAENKEDAKAKPETPATAKTAD